LQPLDLTMLGTSDRLAPASPVSVKDASRSFGPARGRP
jgi:hypothetical protein